MTNVPAIPTTFLPQNTPLVDKNGAASTAGMAFFRDLFNRTGSGTGVLNSVGQAQVNSLSATPSPLNFDINVVVGGASAFGVILFNMVPGQQQMVINNTGFNLTVNAPTGGTIDSGGSYTLTNGKSQIFTCLATQGSIISLQLG